MNQTRIRYGTRRGGSCFWAGAKRLRSPAVRVVGRFGMMLGIMCCAYGRPSVVSGHVEGWGDNVFGQLDIPALDDVIAIAAGNSHSVALRANRTVVAWGDNASGRATVPAGLTDVVAISAAAHSVALRADGTVVVWGSNQSVVTNVPPMANAITAIAAGSGASGNVFTVALRADGTVVAWGQPLGTETDVPVGLSNVVAIATGSYHVLALKEDGTVVAWGLSNLDRTKVPAGLQDVVAIAAGQNESFAIQADGSVVRWGGSGSTELPTGLEGLRDIQVGFQHALALRTDNTIVTWGQNGRGQLDVPAELGRVEAISTKGFHNLVLTRSPLLLSMSAPVQADLEDTVTFAVTAAGEALSFQWQFNGENLEGKTEPTLSLMDVGPAAAGTYTVAVTNPYGTKKRSTVLSFPPPKILKHPVPLTRYRGESAVFSAAAEGIEPLSFQWTFQGGILPGANGPVLSIANLRWEDAGEYSVMVTDAAGGTGISAEAILTVIGPTPVTATFAPALNTSIGGGNPRGSATILAGTRRNGVTDRGLLRFDLSSLPSGAQIQSARLIMTVLQVPRSPAPASTFALHRMITPWGADAAWDNATAGFPWSEPGGLSGVDFNAVSSATDYVTGYGVYEFGPGAGLAEDIQGWVETPSENHGWLLRSESEGIGKTARHFGSSESAPRLEISYSSVPKAPRLTEVRKEGGQLRFELEGEAGWVYRVEHRDQVNTGAWTIASRIPAGAGTNTLVIELPIGDGERFYRLVLE